SFSPGLARNELPWVDRRNNSINPERVASVAVCSRHRVQQPTSSPLFARPLTPKTPCIIHAPAALVFCNFGEREQWASTNDLPALVPFFGDQLLGRLPFFDPSHNRFVVPSGRGASPAEAVIDSRHQKQPRKLR